MKLGICISTFPTKFKYIVFSTKDIGKNLETIHDLGYDGVDLFTHNLNDAEVAEIGELLKTFGMEVPLFAAIWLTENGSYLTDPDKERRIKAIKRYKTQIKVASKLGAVGMPIGFSRGCRQDGETEDAYQKRLAESLKELIEYADNNVKLLIEPINRYIINTMNRVDQALEFISKYRLNSIGLLIDTVHMNIEERSIEKAIELAGISIGHIHITDNNGLAPGEGHLDYKSIIKSIKKTGYNNFLSIEAAPIPSAYECAKRGIEFLQNKLR